ncbi:hypothetical protein OCGS_1932 [Oceaniovalibus guishaninsula JLT2003]|uniref:Polyketide cyclase/dehydrase n=1 Tax=Oceaniovalibus guishaninsula JLT2003 TaxID=1231392 RepID=K2GMJ5_9RHOB|nr:SRPBCC family protein [Oceaniovalibus guishaninsula]EKE43951.1 hypothetical protein OCGS_1932 [Oceaniovalibus guishaninsula JLT2003]
MAITHTIRIGAPSEAVFVLYADVPSWTEWDSQTEDVSLPSGLTQGSAGWLKPCKGPKARIEVTQVRPGRSFTVESRLPFCRMVFGHDLQDDGVQTEATHWVRFTGPLAFLFRRVIGTGIDATLPDTLLGLKRVAEGRQTAR